MPGLIAKKVGMTSIFDENGKNIACTLIQTGPNVVTQVKTVETDGYTAIQVGFDEKKEKRTSAAMKGHFSKASTTPKRKVIEFRNPVMERQLGDELKMEEIFSEGEFVDVVGTSYNFV